MNGKILIFGGADRNETNFKDLTIYEATASISSIFKITLTTGTVPMPRSGHCVVGYGKYMFLFGGIEVVRKKEQNSVEEKDYDDLYILDTGK